MKRVITFILLLVAVPYSYSQDVDSIRIEINDTLNNVKDCIIYINLFRKDEDDFLFPERYSVGDETQNVDLMLVIEKKNSESQFKNYRCNESPAAIPPYFSDSISYKKFNKKLIVDSLNKLICITRGYYRIKVLYNKRRSDGKLDAPNFIASSNWAEFYVSKDEIITSRYLINKRNNY